MANVTKHAQKRAKERAGIGKGSVKKMASKILKEGITHKECTGDLERWVTAQYFHSKQANNIRLYGEQCYIFYSGTLITVLPIPDNLKPEVARLRRLHKEKKYRMDANDKISINGFTLYRIIAQKSFGDVLEGDRGGYIMREANLSHKGDAWVYDNARVYANATVKDNGKVKGELNVRGYAEVSENAIISGTGTISGHSVITGNVTLNGTIQVYKEAIINGAGCMDGTLFRYSGIYTLGEPFAGTSLIEAVSFDIGRWLVEIGICADESEAEELYRWMQT